MRWIREGGDAVWAQRAGHGGDSGGVVRRRGGTMSGWRISWLPSFFPSYGLTLSYFLFSFGFDLDVFGRVGKEFLVDESKRYSSVWWSNMK